MEPFSVEITLDPKGVRAVRIFGKGWQQREAYAFLERVGPLIEQLDALAKAASVAPETPPEGRLQ